MTDTPTPRVFRATTFPLKVEVLNAARGVVDVRFIDPEDGDVVLYETDGRTFLVTGAQPDEFGGATPVES